MFEILDNIYFKYQLSYILIPLGVILYIFFLNLRPYLIYSLIYIAIVGSIDTFLLRDQIIKAGKKYGQIHYYLFLLFHLLLLLPLLEFKKYGYPNIPSFLILIIGILILTFLPYWPYYLNRATFINIYIGTYVILTGIYYLLTIG